MMFKNSNYNKSRDDLYCKFCEKQCKNLNSLKQHEIRCKNNLKRIDVVAISRKGRENLTEESRKKLGWSKGLNKFNDSRVLNISEGLLASKTNTGRAGTPEKEELRKNSISETMKHNPNAGGLRQGSGRGKKGWYKGYYCDSTYELAYVIYNLDHNIKFDRCKLVYNYTYDGEDHTYRPDFILGDGSIVEVKGYHSKIVDAKTRSVTDRPITVLYRDDLKYVFDYIEKNYKYSNIEDLYESRIN